MTSPVMITPLLAPQIHAGLPPVFPQDLTAWASRDLILGAVEGSAMRACGDSWLKLVQAEPLPTPPNDLLILASYCYLQAVYHSIDVIRRLEQDVELAGLRTRIAAGPDQVRRFRREHRRALTDCLTHALVSLWRDRHPHLPAGTGPLPGRLLHNRIDFGFLEPFYLQAQDRVDRAVVLDSMALDD